MAQTPVVLILGAGPRIGAAVADKFASDGYKVAVVSRKEMTTTGGKGYLYLRADFNNPESISALFDAVKAEFQAFPSVVVYNAAALHPPSDADSMLSIDAGDVASDLNVNTVSPYMAAQSAVRGWQELPADAKKIFIYTGNKLNVSILPVPMFLNLGMGKSASAYWIGAADLAYSNLGYRFFYADEREADGNLKGQALDGPAHADFYSQLAEPKTQIPWHATFVKGQGYVNFK